MTQPDPGQDILDRLDRCEARKKIALPGIIAIADGFAVGFISYEIMQRILRRPTPAPLYGSLVVFISVATWLFAKLSTRR